MYYDHDMAAYHTHELSAPGATTYTRSEQYQPKQRSRINGIDNLLALPLTRSC